MIELEERRVLELQKVYEKVDRLAFQKSNMVGPEKPSMKLDTLIQQILKQLEQLESQAKREKTDRYYFSGSNAAE